MGQHVAFMGIFEKDGALFKIFIKNFLLLKLFPNFICL